MSEFPPLVYRNTLVAVFSAAYSIGVSPKLLAAQAKTDIDTLLKCSPSLSRRQAKRAVDESVYVAKLIHEQGLDAE